jgi:alkylhydroperoxidase family enzyme
MRPSITPVEPPFDDDVSALLAQMTGSESREPLLLFRTLARNVPLATAWSTLGAYNLRRGRLSVRDRELIILRTCYLAGCEYEWGVHGRVFATQAQLTHADVLATARPWLTGGNWTRHDENVLAFAEALHERAAVHVDLRAALAESWDEAQFLEAAEVAGFYHGVAYIVAVSGVEQEGWGLRFP